MPRSSLPRRKFLAMLGASAAVPLAAACSGGPAQAKSYPVTYSDAEWRRRLTPDQFEILRRKGTEVAGTSPLLHEKRPGTFVCVADGHPLFASSTKYDSRTGWPSFWQAIDKGAVGTSTDYLIGYPRTEVHCADCGGHLGHIFDDGPKPTGKRHCINGIAMDFRPA